MITPGAALFGTRRVLGDVAAERRRQDAKWGPQAHPDGTGDQYRSRADVARAACNFAAATGELTWAHIFEEEVSEALAESDPVKLRAELVQAAAVAAAWIEELDRRQS